MAKDRKYETRIMHIPFEEEVDVSIRNYLGNRDLTLVRRADRRDITLINGHFTDISERIEQIVEFARILRGGEPWVKDREFFRLQEESLAKEYGGMAGQQFASPGNSEWPQFVLACMKMKAGYPEVCLDDNVAIVDIKSIPPQMCPFKSCGHLESRGFEAHAYSKPMDVYVRVNGMVAHMAKQHEFLPKENGYSIEPAAFYEAFMPGGSTLLKLGMAEEGK